MGIRRHSARAGVDETGRQARRGFHGSVAASGGYWIATGAEESGPHQQRSPVPSNFSAFPTFERSLETVGIFNDGVGTTAWRTPSTPAGR